MRSFLALLLLGYSYALVAQELPDLKYFEALAPRNIGPAGMSGRVTAIDVDLSNSDIIYAGTASGGLWKSTNGGINWRPIFDDQPVGSIGAVAVDQSNPDIIWAGTGEGNPRNSANSGAGIFKSLDGGDTWTRMGLEATKSIHRIIVHRDNPDVVYVGAQGSMWGNNPERGVYRTQDGGKTWERILYLDDETGVADLVVDPTNPNKLIAAMWTFGRQPWTFNSGGQGSGLFVTYDGGDTWERRTSEDGLPEGDLGRIGLAIAPSEPHIVYALVEAEENGLYKSTDGGKTWRLVSKRNIGNRPFYYADIFVDPQNENRIYNLFSLVTRSEDGGKTFEVLLPYSGVHPDHHALWIHPDDPDYLIEGNDGGLNISRDGGDNWRFIPNLPLAQFYHIDHDMDIPYNVGGGMQDNGSWVGPSQAWKAGGITDADWQEVFFGDGFDVSFMPENNRYVYAMSQGGNLGLVDRKTGAGKFLKPVHPEGKELRFNWNAAFAQSPFDNCTIYYGSQYVHKSTDCGQHWTIISPDLTTDDPEKQKQDESGGLTIDATNAENFTTIVAIAPDPFDPNTLWVGTDDGNLQLTRDGGETWTNLAGKLSGARPGSWIPFIEVSETNRGEAFVIVNDYRRNDWRPMAYHTQDYGATWQRIVDEDKVSGHTMSIVQDPLQPNHLWLGTDHGLFFSIDYGESWTKYEKTFPSVTTADLKIHPREHDLVIGTFGRAAWILDDLRPFREMARTDGAVLQDTFAFFSPPDAYLAEYRSYQGIRFAADGTNIGENRRPGAMLTMWVLPDPEEPAVKKTYTAAESAAATSGRPRAESVADDTTAEPEMAKKKKKPGKVKIHILDSAGDTIRRFSRELDPGMNRLYWNLRRDGVRRPSRREADPDDDLPSGAEVQPGVYTVVATYGGHTQSQLLTVRPDPRLDREPGSYAQQEALNQRLERYTEVAATAFDRLREARQSIDLVNKAFANADPAVKDTLRAQGKTLLDSIAALELLYMMPEDIKGIQRNPDNLTGVLGMTSRYLRDVGQSPSQMAELMLDRAEAQTRAVVGRVNDFLKGEFADYRAAVEAAQATLFGTVEPVEIDER
jgi:photosystem II stability/assembly factor-like uncharacterized protein